MSKEVIDEKVVELQFDNRQFEQNVKESMGTLDKLKQKLQLKGAAKAAESEFAAYKSGIFSLKDSVLKMWSSMEYDVGNKMKSLLKSFTIDPIKTGLSEYETQMGAIQTILANTQSKGTTLDQVNEALNTLNEYADKTIYNFTEMTKNIGTFTAAGVDLETSVNAIQGIANLAAVSGSTSQQASTAMYQLSQALSSGTVKLQDWNSVVNAGMGGQVFQDALKETARVHGIAIDEMIESNGSFRESLKEGWLTSEILTETLQKFTLGTEGLTEEQIEANRVMLRAKGYTEAQIDEIFKLGNTATNAATKVKTFSQLLDTLKESAQSGWAQTWAIIIGDFEEAKELWTNVSNVLGKIIGDSAEARNSLLHGALDTGWDKFMGKGIMDEEGYMYQFKKVAKEHEIDIDKMIEEEGSFEKALVKGFKEGTISADIFIESLNRMTKAYENCSDEELAKLGYTRQEIETLAELNSKLQNGEISLEEFTESLSKLSGRTLIIESLSNLFKGLVNIITPIKEAFREFFPATTSEQLYKFIEAFHGLTERFREFTEKHGDNIRRTFRGIFAVLDIGVSIIKIFTKAIGKVVGAFGGLPGGILNATACIGDFLVSVRDVFNASTGLQEFADGVATAMINIGKAFKTFFATAKQKIETSGLDGFLNTLKGIWNFVKTLIGKILDLFGSLGAGIADTLTGSGIGTVVDLLNAGLITTLLIKLKGMFDNVKGIADSFSEILDSVTGSLQAFQSRLKAETIKTIATSVAILAASILVLSFIDQEKLEKSLSAITLLFAVLMGSMSVINKVGALGQTAVSTGMLIGIAASLLLLSFALVRLGKMTDDGMIRGLVIMTGALAVMVGALHWLSAISSSEEKMAMRGAKQMTKIAWMLIVLSASMKIMATMSWEDYGKAMAAMGGSLAIMVGSLTILSLVNGTDAKMAANGAKEMMKLAKMLIVLALAFKLIATMSWEDIGKGAAVMGGGLLALTLALSIMQKMDKILNDSNKKSKDTDVKKVVIKAGQFTAMAAALGLLAVSLIIIATMDWDEILIGLGTIITVIGVLELAIWSVNKIEVKDTAPKMSSLLALAGALAILAIDLRLLGSMKWPTIAKGLTAMVGVLAILYGGLKILSKFQNGGMSAKSLAGMSGSLMLLAIALGMLSTTMIHAGKADFSTIIRGFATMALVFVSVALGAKLLAPVIPTLISFAGGLALLGAACLAAGLGIYLLAAGLSLVSSSLGTAIETICQVLIQSAATIGKAAAALIIGLLDGLVDVTDELVVGILEIILNTLKSLSQFIPEIVDSLMDLIIGVGEKLIEYIPAIVELAMKVIGKLFEAVVDAIKNINTDQLMTIVTSIGIVTLMMYALSSVVKLIPKALLGALGVGAVIAELVIIFGAIGLLYKIPGFAESVANGTKLVKAIEGALGVLTVVTLLTPVLMLIGSMSSLIPAALLGLAAVGVLIVELAALLWSIGKLTEVWDMSDGIAKAGELLQSIGEAIGQFVGGLIGGIGKGVTTSLVKMAEDLSEFAEKLQPFLNAVKSIDGETFKSVINLTALLLALTGVSILDGISRFFTLGRDPFDAFAKNLVTFGDAMVMFSKIVSGNINNAEVDAAATAGIKLAEMASKVPTSGGLWQLAAGSKNIANFGAQLPLFALGIVGFSKIIGSNQFNNTETAAKAGERLAAMASKIPTNGGLWQVIAGGKNLDNFAKQIAAFALGLVGFSGIIGTSTFNNTETAAKAGERLAAMASKIPTTGGLWGALIAGDNDLGSFSRQIGMFALAIVGFTETVGTNTFDNVEPAIKAGEKLANLASKIPSDGLDAAWDMASFKTQMTDFAMGISNFASTVASSDFSKVGSAVVAGAALVPLCKMIPEEGLFKGQQANMASFKEQIILFGEGMAGFMSSIAEISSFDMVLPAVTAGISLVTLAKTLPDFIGAFGKDKGSQNMKSFKEQISLFGEGISGFKTSIGDSNFTNAIAAAAAGVEIAKVAQKIAGIEVGNMSTFSSQLPSLGDAIASFTEKVNSVKFGELAESTVKLSTFFAELKVVVASGLQNLVTVFNNASDILSQGLTNLVTNMISTLNGAPFMQSLMMTGVYYVLAIKTGMSTAAEELKAYCTTMVSTIIDSIKSRENYDKFYNTGKYFASGLATGISDNSYKAINAAQTMVNAINSALRKVLRINSPSKESYEDGEFYVAGLVNALNDGGQDTFKAAGGLAENAKTGLQGAISKVKDLIENGIDTQPTIRPVLDLSNVTDGVGALNGMFGMTPSVGVLSRANSISASMNKNQNGQSDDLLSAVKTISNKLDNASGDTYNINGVTYDNGSELQSAIEMIIRAANIERRR